MFRRRSRPSQAPLATDPRHQRKEPAPRRRLFTYVCRFALKRSKNVSLKEAWVRTPNSSWPSWVGSPIKHRWKRTDIEYRAQFLQEKEVNMLSLWTKMTTWA